MKMPWYGWATVLAVLALLVDIYAFAGLRRVPGVGPAVAAQARLESPLTQTYLVAGAFALDHTPFMQGVADGLAAATWHDAFAPVRRNPALALHALSARSTGMLHALMVPLYWAPPLLFPLALIGWFFRPRKVSLIRGGG